MNITIGLSKSGQRKYILDCKIEGRRKRMRFDSRAEAEKAKADLRKDIRENGSHMAQYPPALRAEWVLAQEIASQSGFSVLEAVNHYVDYASKPPVTEDFKQAVQLFLDHQEGRIEKSSFGNLKSYLGRFKRELGVEKVMNITEEVLYEYLKNLMGTKQHAGKPTSSTTKNQFLKEIKSFLNWAKSQRMIQYNPASGITKFKASQDELEAKENRKEILDAKESARMMEIVQERYPDMAARVAALLFAGLRPDREAASFTYDDIDFTDNTLHVRARFAKDRQDRYIDMPDNLVAWFKWAIDQKHELPVKNWDNRWTEAKKLVVDEWPHDACRHSFASHYLALNTEDKTIKQLGHGDYEMLFKNYRTLVKAKEAEAYFGIYPLI